MRFCLAMGGRVLGAYRARGDISGMREAGEKVFTMVESVR